MLGQEYLNYVRVFPFFILFFCWNEINKKSWPGRKLGKLGNSFPRFLNPSFRFWLLGKIENLEIRKLGIIFPRFPSFRFASFHFSKNFFFSIFNSRQFRTFYLCYVLFSKPFFKAFFPSPKYMFKILPCRNKIYFLWHVSSLMRTWGMLIWSSMKGFNLSHA